MELRIEIYFLITFFKNVHMPLINTTITRMINGIAELSAGNCNNIRIPVRHLPAGAQNGQIVVIETLSQDQYKNRQKDIAKALLSEILGDQGAQRQTQEKEE